MKIGEARALRGQFGEIFVLDGYFVIDVLQHDDDDTIKVAGLRPCRRPRRRQLRLFLLALGRLGNLRLLARLRRIRLRHDRARIHASQQAKTENDI